MIGKKILNQLSPYKPGKQTEEIKEEYNLSKVIKLASNENPYGYSKQVKEFLTSKIHELNIYPDGYAAELRGAIANKLQVEEEQLVFGSGSDEIIQIICRAFLYPGVNTIMTTPTFTQYKHHSLIEGAEIKEIPAKNGHHDLSAMLEAIDDQTKVIWICSPDNPTGTVITEDDFVQFMDTCPDDILVVLDEAYYEYIEKHSRINTLDYLTAYQNLILLRTFSKAYGLAGLRIGYAITSELIASKLNIVRGPFNTTSISQKAALIALQDEAFICQTVDNNRIMKQSFEQFLDGLGWFYYPSQTNFLLINTPISGLKAFDYLIKNGFIIRPGELLGYPNTIRVTIGTEQDMSALEQVLQQLHQENK